jgi:hypothetical protein
LAELKLQQKYHGYFSWFNSEANSFRLDQHSGKRVGKGALDHSKARRDDEVLRAVPLFDVSRRCSGTFAAAASTCHVL